MRKSNRQSFALVVCSLFVSSIFFGNGIAAIQKQEKRGPVTAEVILEPDSPVIGDVLTLTIRVLAESDVEILMPEFGEALDRYAILDWVPKRESMADGSTIQTQTYRLESPPSGPQSIPPILIEFVDRRPDKEPAPEGMDAYEILLPRLDFEVASVVPDSATAELEPPLGELQKGVLLDKTRWPWLLLILLVLVATPLLIWYLQKARRRAIRRTAYELARSRLDLLLAKPKPQGAEVEKFYVELSAIVRRYLEDRFELRAPELTTEEFLARVTDSPDLSRDHQTLLREFLRTADLVKFAGVQPSEDDIRGSIQAATRFLDETRENSPLLEIVEQEVIAVEREAHSNGTQEANRV